MLFVLLSYVCYVMSNIELVHQWHIFNYQKRGTFLFCSFLCGVAMLFQSCRRIRYWSVVSMIWAFACVLACLFEPAWNVFSLFCWYQSIIHFQACHLLWYQKQHRSDFGSAFKRTVSV